MKRYCLICDLRNDATAIAEYDRYHENVWPEIKQSLKEAGIESMQIYRVENRLTMIIDVNADFSFERKAEMDAANAKVQEWETIMGTFQQQIPFAQPGVKWVVMEKIFQS